jgi:hypothetical protein
LRIEPIHDRVDEHPCVRVVLEQDDLGSFADLKLLFLDATPARADLAQIQLGHFATQIEIDLDGRSAVWVGRRRLSKCHSLRIGRDRRRYRSPGRVRDAL